MISVSFEPDYLLPFLLSPSSSYCWIPFTYPWSIHYVTFNSCVKFRSADKGKKSDISILPDMWKSGTQRTYFKILGQKHLLADTSSCKYNLQCMCSFYKISISLTKMNLKNVSFLLGNCMEKEQETFLIVPVLPGQMQL